MKRKDFAHLNCPVAETLGVIGDHWSLLIVRDLFFGLRRFDDLQRDLGIARNILAVRLKKLVQEGIVSRARGESGFPEYRLTDQGLALQPVLLAMAQWGEKYRPDSRGQRLFFVDREHGEPIEPIAVRSRRGRTLGPREIRARPGPGFRAGRRAGRAMPLAREES